MNSRTRHRRVLGVVLLAIALALLVLGETWFWGRLTPMMFMIYWTCCLLATCGAVVCALREISRAMGESRAEQRELIEATLHEIEAGDAHHPESEPPPDSR